MAPPLPWLCKVELKKYFTTKDKVITGGQILKLKVSKQLTWKMYFWGAKMGQFGLATLAMAAIIEFLNTYIRAVYLAMGLKFRT